MEDFQSETDSDYTSYWRDWVSINPLSCFDTFCTTSLESRLEEWTIKWDLLR